MKIMRWVPALLASLFVLVGCQSDAAPTDAGFATEMEVTGELRTHDPGLVVGSDDRPWVIFSTGDPQVGFGAIQVRTSPDGQEWSHVGQAWDLKSEPEWAFERVPGVTNFWAPEVIVIDDTWYMYYTVSTFGSNNSAIGLATNDNFDPEHPEQGWVDHGEVFSSSPGVDNYNAIDPAILLDDDGGAWMAFGSFWGGIHILPIEFPSGKVIEGATPQRIAHRGTALNAIEAPALMYRDGWYYLFVSFDSCCQGSASTYNINVGRSKNPDGPYVDAQGVDLASGGGLKLLESEGSRVGPGGQSVSQGYMAFHYYDESAGGDFRLAIRKLGWSDDGWPTLELADH